MESDSSPVPTYTPIMRQLLDSSVWEADVRARVLWITMLVIASEPGRRGTVDMTLRALAGRACLPVEDTLAALAILSAPDPTSRTRTDEGRRVCLLNPESREWGWRIVNWEKYAEAQKRMYAAARQKTFRQKRKGATTTRVEEGSALRGVMRTTERKGKDRKREREETTPDTAPAAPPPSLSEVASLFEEEGLRGSPEALLVYRETHPGWGGEDWRAAARLWSLREKPDPGEAPVSDWGRDRPAEADEAGQ